MLKDVILVAAGMASVAGTLRGGHMVRDELETGGLSPAAPEELRTIGFSVIEGVRIEQSMRLRPVPESAGAARRMVAACLAGRGQVSAVEDAVLLASEVVTNAVVHGGPHRPAAQVLLRVDSTDARVRIEVHDEGAGFPTVGDGAAGRPSGRGMLLVDLLSSGWGVIVSGTGKLVWFEIES